MTQNSKLILDFEKNINSEKVILRPMNVNDFDKMKVLTSDTEMWYYFTADLSNEQILKNWIESAISELKDK